MDIAQPQHLASILGMDIYLIDQIMKGRYRSGQRILDAGTGAGRNLNWFIHQADFDLHACDKEAHASQLIKDRYPKTTVPFVLCDLSDCPYPDSHFDHIICNAALHFAKDPEHFKAMIVELVRIMKRGGSIFIRMVSVFTMNDLLVETEREGWYNTPSEEAYFMLTDSLLQFILDSGLSLVEPEKHLRVSNSRVMSTLVLIKA